MDQTRNGFPALGAILVTLLLSGCSVSQHDLAPSSPLPATITGRVFGGQQPLVGATVTVWLAGNQYGARASQLANTLTLSDGSFAFDNGAYTCPDDNAPVYITASGGNPGLSGSVNNLSIVLAAGLGSCGSAQSAYVNLNEVSTVVTAFALGHFFTTTLGGGYTTDLVGGPPTNGLSYNAGLALANRYTIPSLVDLPTGEVKSNTAGGQSGAPAITIESDKIYSIANALAACVNSTGLSTVPGPTPQDASACQRLFADTTPPGGTAPADIFQAAVQIALYPSQNVADIYELGVAAAPFRGLATAPNDWTIGVSYTSATLGLSIDGTSNTRTNSSLDIDANGRVWFPSNSSVSPGLVYFDPTTQTSTAPTAQRWSGPNTSPSAIKDSSSRPTWRPPNSSQPLPPVPALRRLPQQQAPPGQSPP